ncbi:MAG: protein kinase [Oscillospiraceae bacterium]|nr:protein kinase [Oscillospiraceae bacterium]
MSVESRGKSYSGEFENYNIVGEPLGSGSQGRTKVFKLQRGDAVQDCCALKVVSLIEEKGRWQDCRRQDFDALKKRKEKAMKEVELMNKLRGNTNIVDYQDHKFIDWEDENAFGCDLLIRMELLRDLRSQMRGYGGFPEKQLSEAEIVTIGIDICKALEQCHSEEIIHRDIKPENIFVNGAGCYKLGDFGIAKILTPGNDINTSIGTLQYAAPEQLRGIYNKLVDIYSLGLVLYELSNRSRLPFADSIYVSDEAVSRRLREKKLPPPACAGRVLGDIILKACSPRPEDRYQSAREFRSALENLNSTEPSFCDYLEPTDSGSNTGLIVLLVVLSFIVLLLAFVLGSLLMRGQREEEPSSAATAEYNATEPTSVLPPETSVVTEPAETFVLAEPTMSPETEKEVPANYVKQSLGSCTVLADSNESGSNTDVAAGAWKDWLGNIRAGAIRFWVTDRPNYSSMEYVMYDIGGRFQTLSGCAIAEENSAYGCGMVIRIYLDGQLAWESSELSYAEDAQWFELDVSGVMQVYAECITDSSDYGYCILDAALTGIQS